MDDERQQHRDIHAETCTTAAKASEIEWSLRYDCVTSAQYNQRMARWYRQITNLSLLMTLFGSTAFVADIPEDDWGVRALLTLCIGAFAIVVLVWQTHERSSFHANQSRRYTLLEARLNLPDPDWTRISYDYKVIEADEVYSIRRNLMLICINDFVYTRSVEGGAEWYAAAYHPLKWHQRIWPLPYLFDFGNEAPKPKVTKTGD